MNSQSIDIEVPHPNRWHFVTGSIVLTIAYIGALILIAWVRH